MWISACLSLFPVCEAFHGGPSKHRLETRAAGLAFSVPIERSTQELDVCSHMVEIRKEHMPLSPGYAFLIPPVNLPSNFLKDFYL